MAKSEPKPTVMTVTNKTMRYGGQTYQIRNLTRVGKYRVDRRYSIPISSILVSITISVIGIWFGYDLLPNYIGIPALEWASFGIAAIAGLVAVAGIIERFEKTRFALYIETSSGSSELFSSTDEEFVDKLVRRISEIMENDETPVSFTANVEHNEITNNNETVMGDKITANNSSVANRSRVTNSFNRGNTINPEIQSALARIEECLKESGNTAAESVFTSMQDELYEAEPDKKRVRSYWEALVKLCPDVSKMADTMSRVLNLVN